MELPYFYLILVGAVTFGAYLNGLPVATSFVITSSLISAMLMLLDKSRSVKQRMRIAESTFYVLALFGGAPGCFIGLFLANHKTNKTIFWCPIMLLSVVWVSVSIWVDILIIWRDGSFLQ